MSHEEDMLEYVRVRVTYESASVCACPCLWVQSTYRHSFTEIGQEDMSFFCTEIIVVNMYQVGCGLRQELTERLFMMLCTQSAHDKGQVGFPFWLLKSNVQA